MKKTISPEEYQKKINKKAPKSNILMNCFRAFLSGGIICTIGQAILNFYTSLELSKDLAASATSITLIFIGILLTGLDIYHKLAKYCGAGTLVPITGFSNAVSSPAIESSTEGFVLGTGVKIFSIAGPVIAYGLAASVVAGIIIYFFM